MDISLHLLTISHQTPIQLPVAFQTNLPTLLLLSFPTVEFWFVLFFIQHIFFRALEFPYDLTSQILVHSPLALEFSI